MFVTPAPVCLPIVLVKPGKSGVFAVVFFRVHAIRLIFTTVPFMIVVVLFVVVGYDLVVFCSQHCGRCCYRGYKGGAQQGGIPEIGHDCFHNPHKSRCVANDPSAKGERYCISHAPGICGMKYHRDVAGGSVLSVSRAQPPSVCLTVAVNESVLGTVQVVNFHELPGMNPSGRTGGRSLTTKTGRGDPGPTCATAGGELR